MRYSCHEKDKVSSPEIASAKVVVRDNDSQTLQIDQGRKIFKAGTDKAVNSMLTGCKCAGSDFCESFQAAEQIWGPA